MGVYEIILSLNFTISFIIIIKSGEGNLAFITVYVKEFIV